MNISYTCATVALIFLLVSGSYCLKAQSSETTKIHQLTCFTKLYGYVKYFHPSDEAAEMDWDAFAVYGAKRILDADSTENFTHLLKELFLPVAPSLEIVGKRDYQYKNELRKIRQYSRSDTLLMWIHHGDGNLKKGEVYSSERVPVQYSERKDNFRPGLVLVDSSYFIVPNLILSENKTKSQLYEEMSEKLSSSVNYKNITLNSTELVIGNLINIYNSIKHFYPYFDAEMSSVWDENLKKVLKSVLADKKKEDTIYWSGLLLSALKDAHVDVYKHRGFQSYPDVFIRYIEGDYIIYNATEEYSKYIGSTVKEVDGQSIDKLVKDEIKSVSYNVASFGYYKALRNILSRNPFSEIGFEIDSPDSGKTTLNVSCNMSLGQYISLGEWSSINQVFYKISEETCYLNLVNLESLDDAFKLDTLRSFQNILIDMRGYPTIKYKDISNLISYFLPHNDTLDWLFVPIVKRPYQTDDSYEYKPYGWNLQKNTNEAAIEIYVLIDHMAISYAESIIGYFAAMKNATLVGSPTAGANGNVNRFDLPLGVTYKYTGMKVLKHDGSRLHGIGFIPDVEVRPTTQGVIEGRDEVLEKALELAKENNQK